MWEKHLRCLNYVSSKLPAFFPLNAGHNSTFVEASPRLSRPDVVINLIHDQEGYGYLGDLCIPRYNLTSSERHLSDNHKWRVVCKAPSNILVVLMGLDMPQGEGEYLQMRRRVISGATMRFQGIDLKKNSVLFGHVVDKNETESSLQLSPFRLAYICAST